MVNDAVILAGGLGTRLKGALEGIPKSMAPVKGKPFIEYLLDYLQDQGIRNVVMATGYLSHVIENQLGEKYKDLEIKYSVENKPLGTGGAISLAARLIKGERFFALNGDTLFKAPLAEMQEQHINSGAEITIALRKVDDNDRYGSTLTDNQNRITSFTEKEAGNKKALINAGIYLINKKLIEELNTTGNFSIEKELFPELVKKGIIYGCQYNAYFIDIGTPEDYERARNEF